MSALPKAVRDQIDRANALVGQQKAMKDGTPPPAAPAPETPPLAAVKTPEPAPPAAPPAAPAAPVDWEHKFKVLQGKYNAEVPRLTRQFQEQEQQLRDMRQQLTNTQTLLTSLGNGQSAAPKAGAPAQPPRRRVKDDEIRSFGPDLYDFIQRAAIEAVEPELSRVAQPFEQRLARTEVTAAEAASTVERSAVQGMYGLLFDQVPNWEEQNDNPEFLAWLQEVDPYAGVPRGQLLAQAYKAHDGPRVVAFFKGFQNEATVIATPTPSAAPTPPQAAPEAQLERLVAPGTPKAGPQGGAPNDAGKRVWSRTDVQTLYRQIHEFTKKGKKPPDELVALERDLLRAQKEGRIRA